MRCLRKLDVPCWGSNTYIGSCAGFAVVYLVQACLYFLTGAASVSLKPVSLL
ncbi:hypothetical protein LZ32DRAFT_440367 [Colletotrichum eremochloae]|nr:hypothetical protein LZ32DRAFT_440367 [Colletotrichum eremochloae]